MLTRSTLVLASLCWLAGCGPSHVTLQDAMDRYDRGLFATAQTMATQVAAKDRGEAKARAAYVAGMAALQQPGRDAAARTWLVEASRATDVTVRARAEAMLGELDRRAGNAPAAATHYERAWSGLTGHERQNTAHAAIEAFTAAGDAEAAAAWRHKLAGSDATPTHGNWTLQAGAFTSRTSADAQRRLLQSTSTRAGLGTPRVHHSERPTGDLWLVHLGAFGSRGDAAAARRHLPGTDLLIVRVH